MVAAVFLQQFGYSLPFNGRKPEDFTCHIEQQGYHILGKASCGLKVWKNSLTGDPKIVLDYATAAGDCEFSGITPEARRDLWKELGLKKREHYQPAPAFFTTQGARVTKKAELQAVLDAGDPIFLIEGGQFQWPPVSVGFRNVVEGILVGGKPVELETLAVVPPIFKVHNLASSEETNALIEHAKPHFEQADVVYMDKDKGKDVNEFRTSLNYRPPHNATPLLTAMEARATQTTRMAFSHLEPVQVLYYKTGGFYHAHDDSGQLQFYIGDQRHLQAKHYGYFDRMLTLFWYMNDVPAGGQTNFPRAGGPGGSALPPPPSMRECTQGIMVPPVAGQAVLWYNMYPHGQQTPYALHAACAVEQGEKYAINVWIYNKPFATRPADWDPDHPRVKELERLAGKKAGSNTAIDSASTDRQIVIVNSGKSRLQVFWKGNGALQPMGNLEPGKETRLSTFVGHTFVGKDGDEEVGSCTVTANGGQSQTCNVGGRTEL